MPARTRNAYRSKVLLLIGGALSLAVMLAFHMILESSRIGDLPSFLGEPAAWVANDWSVAVAAVGIAGKKSDMPLVKKAANPFTFAKHYLPIRQSAHNITKHVVEPERISVDKVAKMTARNNEKHIFSFGLHPPEVFGTPHGETTQIPQDDEPHPLVLAWNEFVDNFQHNASLFALELPHCMTVYPNRGTFNTTGSTNNHDKETGPTVVLTTHISMSKFDRIPILMQWWKGPISIAIWCSTHTEVEAFLERMSDMDLFRVSSTEESGEQEQIESQRIFFHFFFESVTKEALYPHNILRNLALEYNDDSNSDDGGLVVGVDADFIPTWNAHSALRETLQVHPEIRQSLKNERTAFVLPVFEIVDLRLEGKKVTPKEEAEALPKSRNELLQMFSNETAKLWHHAPSHDATETEKWLKYNITADAPSNAEESMDSISYAIEPELRYEPYFLVDRSVMPRYWAGFRGFGLNKVSITHEMVLGGFRFRVLRDFYATHLAHKTHHPRSQADKNEAEWDNFYGPYLKSRYYNTTSSREWTESP